MGMPFRIAAHARPVQRALEFARDCGQVDGGHHKQWVIDQMVRALLEEQYGDFVATYRALAGADWDTGTPP